MARYLGYLYVVVLALAALLSHGCASGGGETLKIDVRDVVGRQFMPEEMTDMLRDLGYDWVPIVDPDSQRKVKTVLWNGEYRMRFEYLKDRQVRIDMRIRQQDGFTRLHFHESGSQTLSEASIGLLERLRQRAVLEFGATNISY